MREAQELPYDNALTAEVTQLPGARWSRSSKLPNVLKHRTTHPSAGIGNPGIFRNFWVTNQQDHRKLHPCQPKKLAEN